MAKAKTAKIAMKMVTGKVKARVKTANKQMTKPTKVKQREVLEMENHPKFKMKF
jgi:hypothetical protein